MRPIITLTALLATLATGTASAATPKTVTLKDSGKTVTVAKGQELRVKLTDCPSCGSKWTLTRSPKAAVLKRLSTLTGKPSCKAPCTGGTVPKTFRWKARSAGRTQLRLESYAFGVSGIPLDRFSLNVRVRG